MVVLVLELLPRDILVKEDIADLLEVLERLRRKQVELIKDHTHETRRKYLTYEEIVMGVECHRDQVGMKVLNRVSYSGITFGYSGIAVEARYYELLWESVGRDL